MPNITNANAIIIERSVLVEKAPFKVVETAIHNRHGYHAHIFYVKNCINFEELKRFNNVASGHYTEYYIRTTGDYKGIATLKLHWTKIK